MTKIIIAVVIIVAALLCLAIPYLFGFFKFGKTIAGSTFKKTACRMYPVVPREWEERTRGSVGITVEDCIGCGICARACPTKAIDVDKKEGKWAIKRMQCIQCSACVDNCPKTCLTMENLYTLPNTEKVVDVFDIPTKKEASAPAGGDGDLVCSDTCVFCGLCAKACPADAIKVDRKAKSWEVDKDACVKCGACIDKCPKQSLSFGSAAEEAEAPAEDGPLTCDKDVCVFCGLCAKNCPVDALTVDRKEKVWEVDEDACVKCGACIDKCPKKCLTFGGAAEEEAPAEEAPAEEAPAEEAEAPAEEAKEEAPAEEAADAAVPKVDKEACIFCGACANDCPCDAIEVEVDEWKVDAEKCIGCGACVDACPVDALSM